jgi:hypothetical protein
MKCAHCRRILTLKNGYGKIGRRTWCARCITAGHMPGVSGEVRDLTPADWDELIGRPTFWGLHISHIAITESPKN